MKRALALVLSALLMGLPSLAVDGTRGKPGDGGTSRVTVRSATGATIIPASSGGNPPVVDPPDGDTTPPNINGIQVTTLSNTSTIVAGEGVWDVGGSLPLEMRIVDENSVELLPWTAKTPPYTHSFTGLTEGQQYCYRAQMRDSVPNASALTSNGSGTNGSECVTLDTTATEEVHDAINATCDNWDITRDDSTVVSCNAGGYFDFDDGISGNAAGGALFTGSGLPPNTHADVGAKFRRDIDGAGGLDDADLGLILGGDCDDSDAGCLTCFVGNAYNGGNIRCESRYWDGADWQSLPGNQGNGIGSALTIVDGDYFVMLQENGWTSDGKVKLMSWSADPCPGSGCKAVFDGYTASDCTSAPNCRDYVEIEQSSFSQVPGITGGNAAGMWGRMDNSIDAIATGDFAVWEHTPESFTPSTSLAASPSAFPFFVQQGQSPIPAFGTGTVSNTGNTGSFGGTIEISSGGTCAGSSGTVNWLQLNDTTFTGVTTTQDAQFTFNADAGAGCVNIGQETGTILVTQTTGDTATPSTDTLTVTLDVTSSNPGGVGPEQLCDNLGSLCECSETMNANDGVITPGNNHNPSNSTTKECNGGNSVVTTFGYLQFVPLSDRPGLGNVALTDYVLRKNTTSIPGASQVNHLDTTFQDETWCMRTYIREGDNVPDKDDNQTGMKGNRFTTGSSAPSVDMSMGDNGFNGFNFEPTSTANWQWAGGGGNFDRDPGTPVLNIYGANSECGVQGWCRVEVCFDHNDQGSDQLRARGRIYSLATQETMSFTGTDAISTNSKASAQTGSKTNLWRLRSDYNQNRWAAYFMVVKRPVDSSYWIGPACEVGDAGGC